MDKDTSTKKTSLKEKTISAFSMFVVFIVFIFVAIVVGYLFDDSQTVARINSRFESIENTTVGVYVVHTYKEDETNNVWITVSHKDTTTESGMLRISNEDSPEEIGLTYENFTDCLIITNVTYDEKYIYFKDSNTLQLY